MDTECEVYAALLAAASLARDYGYAVVIYTPEELDAMCIAADDAEEYMIGHLNDTFPQE